MNEPTKPRVLIINEEEHVARALAYVLDREGFIVQSMPNAAGALAASKELRPDVILLEVSRAQEPSLDLLAGIRQEESLANTSVILVTGRSGPRDIVLGLERGADDYITKPFHHSEVLARLRAQVRMRRLQAQILEAERTRVLLETAGGVAHEMSQPLTAIMGNIELLLQRIPEGDPHRETVRRIHENGERAVALLRRLQRIDSYELKGYPGTSGILDIERSSRR